MSGVSAGIGIAAMAAFGGPVGWIALGAIVSAGTATLGSAASSGCL